MSVLECADARTASMSWLDKLAALGRPLMGRSTDTARPEPPDPPDPDDKEN